MEKSTQNTSSYGVTLGMDHKHIFTIKFAPRRDVMLKGNFPATSPSGLFVQQNLTVVYLYVKQSQEASNEYDGDRW